MASTTPTAEASGEPHPRRKASSPIPSRMARSPAVNGGCSADIGSDADGWRASLARLADLELDALSFGHGLSRLLSDPAGRIAEARIRFGSYYDPWFRPPRYDFTY